MFRKNNLHRTGNAFFARTESDILNLEEFYFSQFEFRRDRSLIDGKANLLEEVRSCLIHLKKRLFV